MQNAFEISFDALYYLGRLMQAEQLDYDYFKQIGDIETNYSLFAANASAELQNAGLITEDFSGDMEVDPVLQSVAKPLFFGTDEASLDLIVQAETVTRDLYKFHTYEGKTTKATFLDGKIRIEAWDDFEELYADILRNAVAGRELDSDGLDDKKFSKIAILKCLHNGEALPTEGYCIYNGGVYKMAGDVLQPITPEDFRDAAIRILEKKGA